MFSGSGKNRVRSCWCQIEVYALKFCTEALNDFTLFPVHPKIPLLLPAPHFLLPAVDLAGPDTLLMQHTLVCCDCCRIKSLLRAAACDGQGAQQGAEGVSSA